MAGQRAAQRFCHKCGAEIPKNSTYCRICGYRREDNVAKEKEKGK